MPNNKDNGRRRDMDQYDFGRIDAVIDQANNWLNLGGKECHKKDSMIKLKSKGRPIIALERIAHENHFIWEEIEFKCKNLFEIKYAMW